MDVIKIGIKKFYRIGPYYIWIMFDEIYGIYVLDDLGFLICVE